MQSNLTRGFRPRLTTLALAVGACSLPSAWAVEKIIADGDTFTGVLISDTQPSRAGAENIRRLTFQGSGTVDGPVGEAQAPIASIFAGTTGTNSILTGGIVYTDRLTYNGNNGKISVRGGPVSGAVNLGLVGGVQFSSLLGAMGDGAIYALGDAVDLVTQNAEDSSYDGRRTQFTDANTSILEFEGTSRVFGDLGAAGDGQNFRDIRAGADNSLVTFSDDVYLAGGNVEITGVGAIDVMGDIHGSVSFADAGFVNIADGAQVYGSITNDSGAAQTGVVRFTGSSQTHGELGTASNALNQVVLHQIGSSASNIEDLVGPATLTVAHNVYARLVAVNILPTAVVSGGVTGRFPTTVNVTDSVYLGDELFLAADNVRLNAYDPDGALTRGVHIDAGSGGIDTNGATLGFVVSARPYSEAQGGLASSGDSSQITTTGQWSYRGDENIEVNINGMLRDGASINLTHSNTSTGSLSLTDQDAQFEDNSWVYDSRIELDGNNHLVMTVNRAADVYITRSQTQGHFSNPAALVLGQLAATGTGLDQDMADAVGVLDANRYGYGNSQANLATQMQRLAPTANQSMVRAAHASGIEVSDALMRQAGQSDRWWATGLSSEHRHQAIGPYDGFDTDIAGVEIGHTWQTTPDWQWGVALAQTQSDVDQRDARTGDTATLDTTHAAVYGRVAMAQGWTAQGALTVSDGSLAGRRASIVGRTAEYETDTRQISADVRLAYRHDLPGSLWQLSPFLNLRTSRLSVDGYTETGSAGSMGLVLPADRSSRREVAAGIALSGTTGVLGMRFEPHISIATVYSGYTWDAAMVTAYAGSPDHPFVVNGLAARDLDSSGVRSTLGGQWWLGEQASVGVDLKHDAYDTHESSSAHVSARWAF